MKTSVLFTACLGLTSLPALAGTLDFDGAGALEAAVELPRVHLPEPPPEMRQAMDLIPGRSRVEGVVFGSYYIRHAMRRWQYGMPAPGDFRFVPDDRWPPLTDWNPSGINWPAMPALPPEMNDMLRRQRLMTGRIKIDGMNGPAEGCGEVQFYADYIW